MCIHRFIFVFVHYRSEKAQSLILGIRTAHSWSIIISTGFVERLGRILLFTVYGQDDKMQDDMMEHWPYSNTYI